MTERTFLTPLNEAEDGIRDVEIHLMRLANAFDLTGNYRMANDLRFRASDLESARKHLSQGRDMALNRYVTGVESGTINMVNAVIAAANRQPLI